LRFVINSYKVGQKENYCKLCLGFVAVNLHSVTKHSTWNRNFLEWPECRVDAGLRTFSAGTLKLVS